MLGAEATRSTTTGQRFSWESPVSAAPACACANRHDEQVLITGALLRAAI
ncbi:hypothetical protein ACFPN7_26410 [Amycolatopsis halotolerans]